MSPFFQYIRAYYQHAYHRFYFLSVCIFMGIFIYFNYRHLLEAGLAAEPSEWKRFAGYYLLYVIPFVFTFLMQYAFFGPQQYYRNNWFWAILLLAPAFFSLQVNANFHQLIFPDTAQNSSSFIISQGFKWLMRTIILLVPIWLLWRIKDRKTQPFYGTALIKNFRPYLVLILVMLPFITLASFQPAFREIYPRAQFIREMDVSHKTLYFIFYELCYGSEFLGVEFFFRGFLVLSLIRICGQQSLLPIACFYCTIHFGKPVAEAISSLVGGLLLGIISYHTRSIRGVLIIHLGIAWMMEIIGWLAGS